MSGCGEKHTKDRMDTVFLDRRQQRTEPALWSVASTGGIVVSAHYRASEAGMKILAAGGNAFDAAAATSAALGVVEPAASGLGGMTLMTVHQAETNRTFVIEGSCRKPRLASPEIVASYPRKSGYKAAAVPANPAVSAYILKHYGTMTAEEILKPAILLAEEGYRMTPFQSGILSRYAGQLRKHSGAVFFLSGGTTAFEPGRLIRQPALAGTLKRIARYGFEEFYLGETGSKILEDMNKNEGFLSRADFDPVPYPGESETLCRRVSNWEVHTLPPPGGGFVLLEMLLLFEELSDGGFEPDTPAGAVLLASIIRKVRQDRIKFRLGLSQEGGAAEEILREHNIIRNCTMIRSELSPDGPAEPGETSHFNVIDRFGNIIACTQSIERSYGAKVVTPSLGFLYNGFMRGFKIENKRHPHYLKAGAVPRSNAAPSIVFTPNRGFAIGSTGSERTASGIFQVLTRLRNSSGFDAVSAPRLHASPDGEVLYEPERFPEPVLSALQHAGFTLKPYAEPWAFSAGGLHLACREIGGQWAVADPRRDGAAIGIIDSPDLT